MTGGPQADQVPGAAPVPNKPPGLTEAGLGCGEPPSVSERLDDPVHTQADAESLAALNEQLREREENYRLLIEGAPEAIVILVEDHITFVNSAALALAGADSADQLVGRSFAEFIHPISLPSVTERIRLLHQGVRTEKQEDIKCVRLDGATRDVDARGTPFVIRGRRGIQLFLRDVSERRQAEERKNLEIQRMQLLVDLHTRAETMTDAELFDFVLEQAVELTHSRIGFFHRITEDQKHMVLTAWSLEVRQQCSLNHQPGMLHAVEDAGIWADAFRLRRSVIVNDYHASEGRRGLPQGHVALTRFMSVPIFQAGRIAYVYCVGNKAVDYDAFDLANLQLLTSEVDLLLGHRAAKRKLMDNEARLRQAMAAGGLGSWEWDLASGQISWDEQTAIAVGSPTSAGSTYPEFIKHIHPEDLPMVERALEKAHRSGSDFRLEARLTWPDGTEHWLAVNGRALRDAAGVPHRILGVVQEITDRKRAEEKLKQQLEELSRWHEVMLSREGRVQELKREVNDLARRLRRPIPYASQDLNDHLEQLNPVRLSRNALR